MEYIKNAYLINLDNRKDRLESVDKRFKRVGLSYTRVSAFKSEYFSEFNNQRLNVRNGACFVSHATIVISAIVSKAKSVAIFEDDVIFHLDFRAKFQEFIKHVPEDWDIIFLGTMPFAPNQKINTHVSRCINAIGSWSYIIRNKEYKKFIEARLDAENKNDMYTALLQKELNVYCPIEGLTAQDPNSISDLKNTTYKQFLDNWKFKHDFNYEKWND